MKMNMKTAIATPDAPPALGPYSQGVRVGDVLFVSGQLPINPKTGQIVSGGIGAQTEQILLNIRSILEEGESSISDIVKVTIYMRDLNEFDEMNRVYEIFFPNTEYNSNIPPARSTVEVSRLPRDASIEIDAVAIVGGTYIDPELY